MSGRFRRDSPLVSGWLPAEGPVSTDDAPRDPPTHVNPEDPATNPEAGPPDTLSGADDAVPVFRPSRALRRVAPRTLEAMPRVDGPPSEIGPVSIGDGGPVSVPEIEAIDTSAFEGLTGDGTSVSDDGRRWAIAIGLVAGSLAGLGIVALLSDALDTLFK